MTTKSIKTSFTPEFFLAKITVTVTVIFMTSVAVNVITWDSGTLLRAQHNRGFGHQNNKACKMGFHSLDYYYVCYCMYNAKYSGRVISRSR